MQKLSKREGLDREVDEASTIIRELEDEVSSAEVEIEVLTMRLSKVDPIFKKYNLVFKRMTKVMKSKNISPLQTFDLFDKNRDGTLQKDELLSAFSSMGINVTPSETEVLFLFLDLDGSGEVDYPEFTKKLKRAGVAIRTKEEDIVNEVWQRITGAGFTLM